MITKLTVFVCAAIDECNDKGRSIRKKLESLLKKEEFNPIGAGIGKNPIIKLNESLSFKKTIVALDLQEIKNAQITLVVTDLQTFAVGTWIEMWTAKQLGQYVILYITSEKKLKNIFLETLVDDIVYDESQLKIVLRSIKI